jgi:hypothetical protein
MSCGVGLSVGAVNSVAAVVSEEVEKEIRTCRTQAANGGLPFLAEIQNSAAEAGGERVARHPFPFDAEIVAGMTSYLIDAAGVDADAVLACPATYSTEESATLRKALDAEGLARVALTPEPIAAAAWLQMRWQPEKSSITLVYDLGGGGLDITLLRLDPDADARIVGRPVRSSAFGGRAFSTLLAHYAHDLTADTMSPGLPGDLPDAAVAKLRAEFIRSSMPLLHECIRSAEIAPTDVGRILLVGGAARPAEVARVLADELGCPVVTTPEPAHCVATGAAALAARGAGLLAPPPPTSLPAQRVAALAGAAALLATAGVVAMYDANPSGPISPPAQALDLREIAPLSPFVPDGAERNGEHEYRAGSTQPHTASWIIADNTAGAGGWALTTGIAAPSAGPDAPLRPPHSTPKTDTPIVESSTPGTPRIPIRVDPLGSGGSRPGTGEPAELPPDLTIPTAGGGPLPKPPTVFDPGTMSSNTPIASTANTSRRSGAPATAESVTTSSAASRGTAGRSATGPSSPSGASTADNSVAGTSSRTAGGTESDSQTRTPAGRSRGNDFDVSTGTSESSRSGGKADSDSGTRASRQSGESTNSSSGTHAGSSSAGNTGSRAGF